MQQSGSGGHVGSAHPLAERAAAVVDVLLLARDLQAQPTAAGPSQPQRAAMIAGWLRTAHPPGPIMGRTRPGWLGVLLLEWLREQGPPPSPKGTPAGSPPPAARRISSARPGSAERCLATRSQCDQSAGTPKPCPAQTATIVRGGCSRLMTGVGNG